MFTLRHILHKLNSRKLGLVVLTVLTVSGSHQVYADTQQFNGDFINNILDVVNVLNMMIAMLTAPAAIIAGWLLTPDWTFGDFFGLREYLYEIWVLVSNIVYIIFAILLLWMAANGIFHPDADYEYSIKKRLPKFLIGILMVPFTWFIVSFTLTMVNKGIAVVMSVPMGTIVSIAGSGDDESAWNYRLIPTYIELDFGEEGGAHGSSENIKCNESGTTANGQPCISPAEFLGNNRSGPFYMIMIYAYDIFKIQNNDFVDNEELCDQAGENNDSCIRTLTGILARFIFSIIWAFFFSLLLIALCVVLLYRAFILWIYIMFSPMFGLAVFFGSEKGSVGGGKLGFKQFFILAAVPLMVACVLSFGLLFIGIIRDNPGQGGAPLFATKQGSATQCTTGTWTVKYCFEPKNDQEYRSYIVIGGNGDTDKGDGRGASLAGAEDYSITFDFGPLFSDLIDNAAGTTGAKEAGGAVGSVQDIFSYSIMNTIALVIIWMAFMAAVKKDEILGKAIEPFENFGKGVAQVVKQAPGLIPLPNGTPLGAIPGGLQRAQQKIFQDPLRQQENRVGSGIQQFLGQDAVDKVTDGIVSANENNALKDKAARARQTQALTSAVSQLKAERGGDLNKVARDDIKRGLAALHTSARNTEEFKKLSQEEQEAISKAVDGLDTLDPEKFQSQLDSLADLKGSDIVFGDGELKKLGTEIGRSIQKIDFRAEAVQTLKELRETGGAGKRDLSIAGDRTITYVDTEKQGNVLKIKRDSLVKRLQAGNVSHADIDAIVRGIEQEDGFVSSTPSPDGSGDKGGSGGDDSTP